MAERLWSPLHVVAGDDVLAPHRIDHPPPHICFGAAAARHRRASGARASTPATSCMWSLCVCACACVRVCVRDGRALFPITKRACWFHRSCYFRRLAVTENVRLTAAYVAAPSPPSVPPPPCLSVCMCVCVCGGRGSGGCLWCVGPASASPPRLTPLSRTRAFPRACAVAERLWSPLRTNDATAALPRLQRQRCRLLERGVDVTPLGPGFC